MIAGAIIFTIEGEPASKANSRQIVTIGGKPSSIKSAKARGYERAFMFQIPAEAKVMLDVPVAVTIHIFYASRRPDLDESVILDAMQAKFETMGKQRVVARRGVYHNDRQVVEKHVFKHLDPAHPRAVITVQPLQPSQDMLIAVPTLSEMRAPRTAQLPLAHDPF